MVERVRRRGLAHLFLWAPAAVVVLALAACGGSGGGPGGPNPPAAPPAPPAGFTVTVSATGVSPRELRVPVGAQVMFVNTDSRSHEMMSDPHPLHTGCPEINAVGMIQRGESKATGTLTAQKSCGFHDNMRDGDTTLRGTIVVGNAEPGGNPGY
jgi:plastocyanin